MPRGDPSHRASKTLCPQLCTRCGLPAEGKSSSSLSYFSVVLCVDVDGAHSRFTEPEEERPGWEVRFLEEGPDERTLTL